MSKPINFILAHSLAVTGLDISSDGSVLLSTSEEGYAYIFFYKKSRLWDIHDGYCFRTMAMPEIPPLGGGMLAKNKDVALLVGLNSKIGLYSGKSHSVVKYYKKHLNKDYLVGMGFLEGRNGILDSFACGSENGKLYVYKFNGEKEESLVLEEEKVVLDLVLTRRREIFVSGRDSQKIYKVEYDD